VFKNVKYPVSITNSPATMSSCTFKRDGDWQGASGTPAIQATWSTFSFSDGRIEDYSFGVKHGIRSHSSITNCLFTSSHTSGNGNNPAPYMYYGVVGDSGSLSSSTVRDCCFKRISEKDVYRRLTIIDLGTLYSVGHNSFDKWDTTWYGQDQKWHSFYYPTTYVHNKSSDTLRAEGNDWAPGPSPDTSKPRLWADTGFIDTTGANTNPYESCISGTEEEPPQTKLAVDSTAPKDSLFYGVEQNYPNPFNPTTQIAFTVPRTSAVKVQIFNVLGQVIRTLVDAEYTAGHYSVEWDGTDATGVKVSSGIYFYRMTAGDFVAKHKMILLK
jgi:hypothetical protein